MQCTVVKGSIATSRLQNFNPELGLRPGWFQVSHPLPFVFEGFLQVLRFPPISVGRLDTLNQPLWSCSHPGVSPPHTPSPRPAWNIVFIKTKKQKQPYYFPIDLPTIWHERLFLSKWTPWNQEADSKNKRWREEMRPEDWRSDGWGAFFG